MKQRVQLFAVIGLALVGCTDARLEPSKRPASVPTYAVWAGGVDGGAYISCTGPVDPSYNYCRVWNDYTGDIVDHGDFRLVTDEKAANQSQLQFLGADLDGEIYLKGNLTLRRIRPARQEGLPQ